MTNYEKWMNAVVGTYDPEEIEQEISVCYRLLTKLERTFLAYPNPLDIVRTVI